MALSDEDMAQIRAYAAKVAARATPPDERRIRVLRKVFGPVYAQKTGGGSLRQDRPAAGHHTPTKGNAA